MLPNLYVRRLGALAFPGNGVWESRAFTDPALNIGGGLRFNVGEQVGDQDMAMTKRYSASRAFGIVVLALFAATPLLAQPPGRVEGAPRYDLATEATLTGTVESVEQIASPGGNRGRRALGGTHITLKTSTETLAVHLGPTAFLNEQKIAVAKGDTLVILGSRITVDEQRVFVAREVKKGDSAWTLRDAAGLPLWRGRAGRP